MKFRPWLLICQSLSTIQERRSWLVTPVRLYRTACLYAAASVFSRMISLANSWTDRKSPTIMAESGTGKRSYRNSIIHELAPWAGSMSCLHHAYSNAAIRFYCCSAHALGNPIQWASKAWGFFEWYICFFIAIVCPWLDFHFPPRCPQVVWHHWGEIEPFSATLALDRMAECDQPGKNLLKYSGVEPSPRQWDSLILPVSYRDWPMVYRNQVLSEELILTVGVQ